MNQNNAEDDSKVPPLQGLKILLVEDDLMMLEMLVDYLVHYGARVISVTSAAQALEVIQLQKADILLSNIVLPEEDGYSLIKKVRRLAPEQGGQTPAIAVTASVRETNRARLLEAGFQGYLAKPFKPEELVELISTLASFD